MKGRAVVQLLLGFSVGAASAAYVTWLYVSTTEAAKFRAFAHARMVDMEIYSWDTFRAEQMRKRHAIHANYANFALHALEEEGIEQAEYDRAVAIAFTRICIERDGDSDAEKAHKYCEAAQNYLKEWNPNRSFSEFRALLADPQFHPVDLGIE